MAARLVSRQVSLIFAGGPAAHVAKTATVTIPIVEVWALLARADEVIK